MDYIKRVEQELIEDWQRLQLEKLAHIKAEALRVYYLKFRHYQRQRRRHLELSY